MTQDEAIDEIIRAISNNLNAPTWHFRPICSERLASRAEVTTVRERLNHTVGFCLITDPSVLFADTDDIEALQEHVREYLYSCESDKEMLTNCKKIPFVPRLFDVKDEKYSFDVEALRKFEKSLPADALVPKKHCPRPGSPTRALSPNEMLASDAMLLFTLRHKYGLTKDDAHNLVVWSHPFGSSRNQIKEFAQQAADSKDPKCTAIDRLIARVVNSFELDYEAFMAKAAADGLTKEETLMFLAEVCRDGFMAVDYP
ncbi:hypothetical protein GGF32_006733 [Allomyces javanicus]|nr:hypothetical protein GGF32_006733 [Allomyces javanicus]